MCSFGAAIAGVSALISATSLGVGIYQQRKYSGTQISPASDARQQELTRIQMYRAGRQREESRRLQMDADQERMDIEGRRMKLTDMSRNRRMMRRQSAEDIARSLYG